MTVKELKAKLDKLSDNTELSLTIRGTRADFRRPVLVAHKKSTYRNDRGIDMILTNQEDVWEDRRCMGR